MTGSGTFIINGAERVIVSQLHRSPGVFFGQSFHANGTKLYSARVIPFKGSWIEFATDFVDEDTGEVVSIERNEIILDRDTVIEKDNVDDILESGSKTILLHREDGMSVDYAVIHNTLQKDPTNSEKEAVEHIYRQLRNAEPPDYETAKGIIDKLFFSEQRYNLGEVGRYRMNKKLGLDVSVDQLANQFGVGLSRMARTIRERMNVRDNEVFTPIDLINAKTLSSVINSFFGTNQLSQFMDQTNPLAEITHKRRLSALGPGGLSRERAGFEVRDVH